MARRLASRREPFEAQRLLWRSRQAPRRLWLSRGRRVIVGAPFRQALSPLVESPHMPKQSTVAYYHWKDVALESVTPTLDRKLITGERMMLAQVFLKKGCIVPRHQHENEQLTYVLEGGLRLWVGEDLQDVYDVMAGDVLFIPSNVPHKARALEDTLDVDVFSPPRQDWLDKTDAYLRSAPAAQR